MAKDQVKNVGIAIKEAPKKVGEDAKCPFYGNVGVRGNVFVGTVVSAKVPKSISVAWERKEFVKKYERYVKKRTKVRAHVSAGFDVKEGDIVKIAECRPISKTKHFVVIEKLNSEE